MQYIRLLNCNICVWCGCVDGWRMASERNHTLYTCTCKYNIHLPLFSGLTALVAAYLQYNFYCICLIKRSSAGKTIHTHKQTHTHTKCVFVCNTWKNVCNSIVSITQRSQVEEKILNGVMDFNWIDMCLFVFAACFGCGLLLVICIIWCGGRAVFAMLDIDFLIPASFYPSRWLHSVVVLQHSKNIA